MEKKPEMTALRLAFGTIAKRYRNYERRRIENGKIKVLLTQAELSVMMGMPRSYVGKLESGKMNPSLETIFKLCVALDVRPSSFMRELEVEMGLIR